MRTKNELENAGIKFQYCNYRWISPGYELETCEFYGGVRVPMDYIDYLTLMGNRMNKKQIGRSVTDERYIIIKHWKLNHWRITLVELLKEDE